MVIDALRLVSELPRTANGKVDRAALTAECPV
jgi:acyl-coenzyme A synthetase/AMP-(fatty) acid ligase